MTGYDRCRRSRLYARFGYCRKNPDPPGSHQPHQWSSPCKVWTEERFTNPKKGGNSLKREHKMARVCTKMWNESTHLVIPSMKDWNNDSGLMQRETTKGHCHSWWSLGKYQTGTGTWVLTICDFFARKNVDTVPSGTRTYIYNYIYIAQEWIFCC